MELAESRKGGWTTGGTGFPKPIRDYRWTLQGSNVRIEDTYGFVLDHIMQSCGYAHKDVRKITDIFATAEMSSFFGAAYQRIGIQQEKASQFLATIGKMVKELFQLVRELRIIDERLSYYRDSMSGSKSAESADITLKGIWIDLVEQGAKNPASVYGMARELQFITLPDLFFSIHPQRPEDVDTLVNRLEFNRKVKEVLKRKLRSYLEWKVSTFKEHQTRRTFTLKYLRQHYDIIRMYMAWVKPYLKNIARMHPKDMSEHPMLVKAFEFAKVEVELLAKKMPMLLRIDEAPEQNKTVYSVIVAYFSYTTRPQMSFSQDGVNRGPIHAGYMEVFLRAYAWTQEEIDMYLKMREKEDMELFGVIDDSLRAAMDALGDDLEKYLEEAGETLQKDKPAPEITKPRVRTGSIFEPFLSVFRGFGELFGALGGYQGRRGAGKKGKKVDKFLMLKERAIAAEEARKNAWYLYKDYKKMNNMLTW